MSILRPPSQETAAWVAHLVRVLQAHAKLGVLPRRLRVLDLCTGSGCIPLLFQHQFYDEPAAEPTRLNIMGVDLSRRAVDLAKFNKDKLLEQQLSELHGLETKPKRSKAEENQRAALRTVKIPALKSVELVQADVLAQPSDKPSNRIPALLDVLRRRQATQCDVLMSNPPYISPTAFNQTTSRSVRNYEPRLALVPPRSTGASNEERGDLFYPRLYAIADEVQAKMTLFEVGDLKQALRVASLAKKSGHWGRIEIWRDDPAAGTASDQHDAAGGFPVRGSGNGRSVFCVRRDAAIWVEQCQNHSLCL